MDASKQFLDVEAGVSDQQVGAVAAPDSPSQHRWTRLCAATTLLLALVVVGFAGTVIEHTSSNRHARASGMLVGDAAHQFTAKAGTQASASSAFTLPHLIPQMNREGLFTRSGRTTSNSHKMTVMAVGRRQIPRAQARQGHPGMERYGGRLGKLVMKELMGILSAPLLLKVGNENVDVELVSLINIVQVDMSADNRVAKVLVSAHGADIEKKRAVKWLNENTKAIRFALAQQISHLKTTPQLQFVAFDSASGEVLSILDQLRAEREARETQSKGSDTLDQM